eukprot:3693755-Rhodomonas_salina.1
MAAKHAVGARAAWFWRAWRQRWQAASQKQDSACAHLASVRRALEQRQIEAALKTWHSHAAMGKRARLAESSAPLRMKRCAQRMFFVAWRSHAMTAESQRTKRCAQVRAKRDVVVKASVARAWCMHTGSPRPLSSPPSSRLSSPPSPSPSSSSSSSSSPSPLSGSSLPASSPSLASDAPGVGEDRGGAQGG